MLRGRASAPRHSGQALPILLRTHAPQPELLATRDAHASPARSPGIGRTLGDKDQAGVQAAFLEEIGYLLPQPASVAVTTENVDAEIAHVAGPQLVVPVMNARFALNAANARWGSLYDALYGTDVILRKDGADRAGAYNPVRGAKVIAWARDFLDTYFPLATGSHASASSYVINDGTLRVDHTTGDADTLADATA